MPNKYYKILLAVMAVAITAFYFFVNPAQSKITPFCVIHKTTGLYCFGCGGQRAFHAVLHGRFSKAFHENLLIFFILPIVVFYVFSELLGNKKIIKFIQKPIYFWGFLLILISFMILRNLPFYPFNLLIPDN